MKGCHHILIEGDELIRCCVGSEEGGNERTQTSLFQDGLKDTTALFRISLDKNLKQKTILSKQQNRGNFNPLTNALRQNLLYILYIIYVYYQNFTIKSQM